MKAIIKETFIGFVILIALTLVITLLSLVLKTSFDNMAVIFILASYSVWIAEKVTK